MLKGSRIGVAARHDRVRSTIRAEFGQRPWKFPAAGFLNALLLLVSMPTAVSWIAGGTLLRTRAANYASFTSRTRRDPHRCIGGFVHARACSTSPQHNSQRLPSVAYEDDHMLIINKPFGLGFHGEEDGTPGVMTVLRSMQARGELDYQGKLYPVHRLDKVTSGCLMLAKTAPVASEVMAALAERRVAKYYVALSDKKPSKKMGTVSGDMTRGRRSTWRLTRGQENPAVTSFVQRSFTAAALVDDIPTQRLLRLFLLRPSVPSRAVSSGAGSAFRGYNCNGACNVFSKTGKSHQLRVALRSLSAPILGDELYYTGVGKDGRRSADEDRTYLHACALRLFVQGELLQVVVPPWEGGGTLFQLPPFMSSFLDLFPEELAGDRGEWFSDSPLLRSDLSELAGGSAGSGKAGPESADRARGGRSSS